MNDIERIIQKIKKYCSTQERCKYDIIRKMSKYSITEKDKKRIFEILINQDFLNEIRFTNSFVIGKFKINKWGKKKIVQSLIQKNISSSIINESLKEIDHKQYLFTIDKLFKKKQKTINSLDKKIQKIKIVNYLLSKGYESEIIWDRIKHLKY